MEDEDESDLSFVQSEIHESLKQNKDEIVDQPNFCTTFEFQTFIPNTEEEKQVFVDSDGDFDLPRKKKRKESLKIFHASKTNIDLVGIQVWKGCLLLADYIIENQQKFQNQIVIELGAGTGIAGIITARYAKRVFITDYCDSILNNCKKNIESNYQMLSSKDAIKVRKFDWNNGIQFPLHPEFNKEESNKKNLDEYSFSTQDILEVRGASYIIAADGKNENKSSKYLVIYDEFLTNALFQNLQYILCGGRKLILSMEKRFNFALDGSKYRLFAKAHEHFLLHLNANKPIFDPLTGVTINPSIYDAKKIEIDFPQYFEYERNKDLEIWEISLK